MKTKLLKIGIVIGIGILLVISGCVSQQSNTPVQTPTSIETPTENTPIGTSSSTSSTSSSENVQVLVTPDTVKNPQALTVEQLKVNAIEISYESLSKDNQNQVGKIIKSRLAIIQIDPDGGIVAAPLKEGTTGSSNLDIQSSTPVYLLYNGKSVELYDLIDVWGEVEGLKAIPQPVPEIKVLYAELVKKI